MKRWIHASNVIERNGKIQKGLQWNVDWHRFEVKDVAPDRKTCKITEDWINEDTGEEEHREYVNNIAVDEKDPNQEYLYNPEYAKYAEGPDYSWWARRYASGADNYPWSWESND